ncbi:unnamed protein product [Linum trigynum]|uniref:Uncharacterized protein n=1 Tax=Linum trigynum TaxID=586398 RepID=A0AAV2DFY9_9ROSI
MRDALSSLLALDSWLGRWVLQIIGAALITCMRNQAIKGGRSPRKEAVQVSNGGCGRGEETREKVVPGVHRRACINRRLAADRIHRNRSRNRKRSTDEGDFDAIHRQKSKKFKQRTGGGWRFWLPASLEMDCEVLSPDSSVGMDVRSPIITTDLRRNNNRMVRPQPFGGITGKNKKESSLMLTKDAPPLWCFIAGEIRCSRASQTVVGGRAPDLEREGVDWGRAFPNFPISWGGIGDYLSVFQICLVT